MPKLKYILRGHSAGGDENKKRSINLKYSYKNSVFLYSLKYKLAPKYWNEETQLVRNTTQVPDRATINDVIKSTKYQIDKYYSDLVQEHGYVTNDMLREKMDVFLKRTEAPDRKITLIDYFGGFIASNAKVKNAKTKGGLSKNTLTNYGCSLSNFKKYDAKAKLNNRRSNNKMARFNWQFIDMDFYYDFITYMEDEDFCLNTIGTHIKHLITIMNEATRKKINTNLEYQSDKFAKTWEKINNIYLSDQECERLFNLELIGVDVDIRDAFLIGCYTGLRVGDFLKLYAKNFSKEDGLITKINQKTGKTSYIPVHWIVIAILERRGGTLPNKITNKKLNERIKIIGKAANILGQVEVTRTKGGESVTTAGEKFEFIYSHTARRSFATNAYLAGMAIEDIMTITQHSTVAQFLNYIKISPKERAKIIAQNPWWKGRAKMQKVS